MKKLLLLFTLSTAALATNAQVGIGLRAGANFASLHASKGDKDIRDLNNDNSKTVTGFVGGAVFNFGLSEVVSLQPEILYSQQGSKQSFSGITTELKTNYLQVPVLAKFNFVSDNFKIFANAGPYAAYWMSGKYKTTPSIPGLNGDIEFDDDIDDDGIKSNRLDIGYAVGIGAGLQTGPGWLELEVRYNGGLADMTKYKNDRPSETIKLSNQVIGISLAYLFMLGQ